MADCVLGLQRQGTACRNLGFRHQGLVNQHVTDGADVRIGVDLGVNRLLLGQFAGFGQVVHDLVDVRRDGLRNLESQTEAHAVDVVRAEVLHRVFTGERLVGGFHADCPPSTGALGVVGEDGEEDSGASGSRDGDNHVCHEAAQGGGESSGRAASQVSGNLQFD